MNAEVNRTLSALVSVLREANDQSTHPTAVEYGAQEMMKGKSPAAAAKATAKKLDGAPNMFLGSPTEPVHIDPKVLEGALWNRLIDFTVQAMSKIKAGKEHYALDGTVQHFRQKPQVRVELKARIASKLGHNPFTGDDA